MIPAIHELKCDKSHVSLQSNSNESVIVFLFVQWYIFQYKI